MRRDQIALQLYTVRGLMEHDLAGTLRAVAAEGYRAVELAGLPVTGPGELARDLAASGLQVVAAHESIERLRADLNAVAEPLLELDCPRVVVPWISDHERRTAGDVHRLAAEIGELGRRLGERGLRLGYHNHAFEFAPVDGTTIWDILLGELPPEVEIELDVYWAAVAGRDPVAEIAVTADRVRLLHMKDRAVGPEPRDAPAGSGTLDFPQIVEAARDAGVEWYVVELDEPGNALDDIGSALAYLESLAHA